MLGLTILTRYLMFSLILRPCFSPPTWPRYEATQRADCSPPTAAGTVFTFSPPQLIPPYWTCQHQILTQRECALNWCAYSQASLHQTSVGRRMEVCFSLEMVGKSSTVLEGHSWRSVAYWSVMQESTTVRCLMLLGWPQGACDWK